MVHDAFQGYTARAGRHGSRSLEVGYYVNQRTPFVFSLPSLALSLCKFPLLLTPLRGLPQLYLLSLWAMDVEELEVLLRKPDHTEDEYAKILG